MNQQEEKELELRCKEFGLNCEYLMRAKKEKVCDHFATFRAHKTIHRLGKKRQLASYNISCERKRSQMVKGKYFTSNQTLYAVNEAKWVTPELLPSALRADPRTEFI